MSDVIESKKPKMAKSTKKRTMLGQPDAQTLEALASAAIRHLSIDSIQALCGSSASLDIAKVAFTETTVDSVAVGGLSTQVSCGAAVLNDVKAILELNFTAHWRYDLKWLGGDSGIKVLGSKANTVELHDIHLPMLQDFRFDIPQIELSDVAAKIDPLTSLQFGGSDLEGLKISNTDAPADGFSLSGIDLGNLEITGLKVPSTRTGSVQVDSFKPVEPLTLPAVSLGPITIPSIEIDDVSSEGSVSVMGAELETIEAPIFKLGNLFQIKLVVDPVLHLQIGALVLSELEARAHIDSVVARDIRSTVCVEGLSMEDLVLEEASVDKAVLS